MHEEVGCKVRRRLISKRQKYPCMCCGQIFNDIDSCMEHKFEKCLRKFECNCCGLRFSQQDEMVQHQKSRQSCHTRYFPCNQCGERFCLLKQLKKHQKFACKSTTGCTSYDCSACLGAFRSTMDFQRHLSNSFNCIEYFFQNPLDIPNGLLDWYHQQSKSSIQKKKSRKRFYLSSTVDGSEPQMKKTKVNDESNPGHPAENNISSWKNGQIFVQCQFETNMDCDRCEETFCNGNELRQHVQRNHGGELCWNSDALMVSNDYQSICQLDGTDDIDDEESSESVDYNCLECEAQFKAKQDFINHSLLKHGVLPRALMAAKDVATCPKCLKAMQWVSLKRHFINCKTKDNGKKRTDAERMAEKRKNQEERDKENERKRRRREDQKSSQTAEERSKQNEEEAKRKKDEYQQKKNKKGKL